MGELHDLAADVVREGAAVDEDAAQLVHPRVAWNWGGVTMNMSTWPCPVLSDVTFG